MNVIVTRLGVDLSTDAGDLLVTSLSKIAELERRKLMERANAGRERCRQQGLPLERRPSVDAAEVLELRKSGRSIAQTAAKMGVSTATVTRMQAAINDRNKVVHGAMPVVTDVERLAKLESVAG